jgi:hypothetical protein
MSEGGQPKFHKPAYLAAHPEVAAGEKPDPRSAPDRQDEVDPDHGLKADIRANARWIMAELDWARSGRTAEERERLNP